MKPSHPACLALLAALALQAQGAISVYVSPNGVESAESSGIRDVITEDFSSWLVGDFDELASELGVYRGGNRIIAPNVYGGHEEGNYLGVARDKATVLTLKEEASYFGFYFSAGDAGNLVELYSQGNLILTFNTGDLIAMLPRTEGVQIEAVNGNRYNTIDYYGQPQSGGAINGHEPYAYVHFFATNGTTFDQIRFSQSTDAIFETDNHSIRATRPDVPDSLVNITHLAVPEPSGAVLAAFSLCVLGFLRRR